MLGLLGELKKWVGVKCFRIFESMKVNSVTFPLCCS